jgi:molybdenum cofactor cytidylyltransferase
MIFGEVPSHGCAGAILAHSIPAAGLKKGHVLSAEDAALLLGLGITSVTAALLEAGDTGEDDAAARIAAALTGAHLRAGDAFTGRANLYAAQSGVLRIDVARVDAINSIHESITVATLPAFEPMAAGAMAATVKIIPYAAPEWAVARAEILAREGGAALYVAPFRPKRVTLISTETAGFKASLLEKNAAVTRARVTALGSRLDQSLVCAHQANAIAEALKGALDADLILIFGASANSDRHDAAPSGIALAGGVVDHVGMPVDPGNLLVLARIGHVPVVALPGCARSPKRNGFDWVLERLCADLPVTQRDVMGMGVGGLLKEIPTRPQPREGVRSATASEPRIDGVLLAAGRATRMGSNKLLAQIGGRPLVSKSAQTALDGGVRSLVAVTGHEADVVANALPAGVHVVHNPDYASGMASSLRAGLAALSENADAAIVFLGDMPAVRAADVAKLIAAFDPGEGRGIVVPIHQGKRGHPVLFGRAFWAAIATATGDQGARQALLEHADSVFEVPIDNPGVLMDADTPEALDALRRLMTE